MLCFIHIERASGTTFHSILRNNYYNYLKLTPWEPWTNVEKNTYTEENLSFLLKFVGNPKGIGGHLLRAYSSYEKCSPNIKYATFFREPVSRLISHFQYQINVVKKKWRLNDFLAEKRLQNFMTKRIAGEYDVEKAKRLLKNNFFHVGLTERFDESLIILKEKLKPDDFEILYEKRNAAKDNRLRDKILSQAKIVSKIREHNLLDLELYEYVQNDLFKLDLEKYNSAIKSELPKFSSRNINYRFPLIKCEWHRLYRYGYYNNIDWFGYKFGQKTIGD